MRAAIVLALAAAAVVVAVWLRSGSVAAADFDYSAYERMADDQLDEGSRGYGDDKDFEVPRDTAEFNSALFEPNSHLPLLVGATSRPQVVGDLSAGGARPIVIFLHGLGESNDGRLGWMQQLAYTTRVASFVLPVATVRRMTLFRRSVRAWFDIRESHDRRVEALDGFEEARQHVHALVAELQPLGRPLIVAGYSMGAALGTASAFTLKGSAPVWGVCAISGYAVPFKARKMAVATTRFWAGHSTTDPIVPFEWGQRSFASIKSIGAKDPLMRVFSTQSHALGDEAKQLLRDFIQLAHDEKSTTSAASKA